MVAQAARGGVAADDFITVGSPGMQADHVSELNVDGRHVWGGAANDDPVSGEIGHLDGVDGNAPADWYFGANSFTIDTEGHSDYWRPGSQSLRNQAAIVTGRYDDVDLIFGKAPAP